MSEIAQIIDTLESKVQKLLSKIDNLEQENKNLKFELTQSSNLIQTNEFTLSNLKKDIDSLKMTNSLLGSEDYKRDTKLKINSLIREIDYCIAQLAD